MGQEKLHLDSLALPKGMVLHHCLPVLSGNLPTEKWSATADACTAEHTSHEYHDGSRMSFSYTKCIAVSNATLLEGQLTCHARAHAQQQADQPSRAVPVTPLCSLLALLLQGCIPSAPAAVVMVQ